MPKLPPEGAQMQPAAEGRPRDVRLSRFSIASHEMKKALPLPAKGGPGDAPRTTKTSRMHKSQPGKPHSSWSAPRIASYKVLASPQFKVLICIVVFVDLLLMVAETDYSVSSGELPWQVLCFDLALLAFYIAEVSCSVYVFRAFFFGDACNLVDFGVVIGEIAFMMARALPSWLHQGTLPFAAALRLMRALRVARILRTARTLQMFRELYMMMHGFMSAMRAILWATVLLALILTLWGILAVNWLHEVNLRIAARGTYDNCERCPHAFESVRAAILTFIQTIVAGDSWGVVTIPIIEESPGTCIIFFMVLVTINLGLLNLILTVIVDRAQQAHQEDTKLVLQQRKETADVAKRSLLKICQALDEDSSGCLTLDELTSGWEEVPEFEECMALMDVKKEDLDGLFLVMDADSSGALEYGEFVEQLYKMKTEDSQMMLAFLRHNLDHVSHRLKKQMQEVMEGIATTVKGQMAEQQEQINGLMSEQRERLVALAAARQPRESAGNPSGQELPQALPEPEPSLQASIREMVGLLRDFIDEFHVRQYRERELDFRVALARERGRDRSCDLAACGLAEGPAGSDLCGQFPRRQRQQQRFLLPPPEAQPRWQESKWRQQDGSRRQQDGSQSASPQRWHEGRQQEGSQPVSPQRWHERSIPGGQGVRENVAAQ